MYAQDGVFQKSWPDLFSVNDFQTTVSIRVLVPIGRLLRKKELGCNFSFDVLHTWYWTYFEFFFHSRLKLRF